ncbi:OmpH/Skp family outer membrane protein [Natronospora cellulosivora (SeqCode)]
MKRWRSKCTMSLLLILLLTSVLSLYLVPNTFAQSEYVGRVAYIDLWAVFNVHPEKPTAEAELNDLAQSMQSELEERARDLTADEQQELLKQYQSKLSEKEQELIQEIIDSIKEVVIILAEEKQLEMVLDSKNVIYGGYDLSDDIIERINKELQSEETINLDDDSLIELEYSSSSDE